LSPERDITSLESIVVVLIHIEAIQNEIALSSIITRTTSFYYFICLLLSFQRQFDSNQGCCNKARRTPGSILHQINVMDNCSVLVNVYVCVCVCVCVCQAQYIFLHQSTLELLNNKGNSQAIWFVSYSGLEKMDSLDAMEGKQHTNTLTCTHTHLNKHTRKVLTPHICTGLQVMLSWNGRRPLCKRLTEGTPLPGGE